MLAIGRFITKYTIRFLIETNVFYLIWKNYKQKGKS